MHASSYKQLILNWEWDECEGAPACVCGYIIDQYMYVKAYNYTRELDIVIFTYFSNQLTTYKVIGTNSDVLIILYVVSRYAS
jgi:hypothetical protein